MFLEVTTPCTSTKCLKLSACIGVTATVITLASVFSELKPTSFSSALILTSSSFYSAFSAANSAFLSTGLLQDVKNKVLVNILPTNNN